MEGMLIMGEYRHFEILLTQDHKGLVILKLYYSYSFHLMSIKLYEDICCQRGIQAIALLGISMLKSFVTSQRRQ